MDKDSTEQSLAAMEDALKKRYVQMLFEHDRVIRSHAIYEATAIESLIENIIALHFCPDADKHLRFIGLMFVTAEVTFSKKIDILIKVLKDSYPDILEDIPQLEKELNSVRRFRNKFAHNELILRDEKISDMKDGIHLRSINRDGTLVEEFIPVGEADRRVRAAQRLRWYTCYVWLEVDRRVKGEKRNQLKGFLEAINSGAMDKLGEEPQHAPSEPASASEPPRQDSA